MRNTRTIYKKLFTRARKEGWAIGQFNAGSFEVMEAIVRAAARLRSPVLVGTSEGESSFLGLSRAVLLVRSWEKELGIPVLLNLDHAHTLGYIRGALKAGYDSVHFDGSRYSFQENVKLMRQVVRSAHKEGALTEGEIEKVPGSSHVIQETPEVLEEYLTSPERAREFVSKTGADRIAVNIGTFHGMSSSGEPPRLRFALLRELAKTVPSCSLVLHGASGAEGKDLRKAVRLGISKLNVNTELRLAFCQALAKKLREDPDEIVPYKYFPPAMEKVQKEVERKMRIFGSIHKLP